MLTDETVQRVLEADHSVVRHPQPDRGCAAACLTAVCIADTGAVDAVDYGQIAAAAATEKREVGRDQAIKRGPIQRVACALANYRSVGNQSKACKRAQLRVGSAGDFARRVQVFDPDPPFALRMPRHQPTAERRQQRSDVQRPGGRRCEAAAVVRELTHVECVCGVRARKLSGGCLFRALRATPRLAQSRSVPMYT